MLSNAQTLEPHVVPVYVHGLHPTASDEVTRVREHLLGAIMAVGSRPIDDLTAPQRAHRTKLLGELIRYAVAGRFPKNEDLTAPMRPAFVDQHGTRCAMAHLIEHTGERVLVDRVARSQNHAFVRELAGDAVLRAWLIEHGLSAEEAARIQPGYCGSPAFECVCDTPVVQATDLVAGVVQADGRLLVDEVFQTANGVAVGATLDVISNPGSFGEGVRVFADVTKGARIHFAFADADTLAVAECAMFGSAPDTLDVAVLLDIVNGAECETTLNSVDRAWVDESECEPFPGDGGAPGVGGAGGAAGGGGSAAIEGGNGAGGGSPGEDGASSDDGCSCSFASLPSHESALFVALLTGVVIARRRFARD